MRLEVSPAVMIPRPASEAVAAAAVHRLPKAGGGRVLDLGTGSGCLLLSCLKRGDRATGVGIDLSELALAVARRNATAAGFADRSVLVAGDFGQLESLDIGQFDVIVSNPPYLATGPSSPQPNQSASGVQPAVADAMQRSL